MQLRYNYTNDEIKKLLKDNIVILMDTREQKNQHIIKYFDDKKIKYENRKVYSGDYSIKLLNDSSMGLIRDIYFPVAIEKKNSVDELAQSFKERTRFEAEFIRAKGNNIKMYLLVEDGDGYENLILSKYRSKYDPKALLGSLKTFEARYDFTSVFLDKKYSGNWIYSTLKYYVYEKLRN